MSHTGLKSPRRFSRELYWLAVTNYCLATLSADSWLQRSGCAAACLKRFCRPRSAPSALNWTKHGSRQPRCRKRIIAAFPDRQKQKCVASLKSQIQAPQTLLGLQYGEYFKVYNTVSLAQLIFINCIRSWATAFLPVARLSYYARAYSFQLCDFRIWTRFLRKYVYFRFFSDLTLTPCIHRICKYTLVLARGNRVKRA